MCFVLVLERLQSFLFQIVFIHAVSIMIFTVFSCLVFLMHFSFYVVQQCNNAVSVGLHFVNSFIVFVMYKSGSF